MIYLILITMAMAISVFCYAAMPLFIGKTGAIVQKRSQAFASKLDRIVMKSDAQRLSYLYVWMPVAFMAAGYLFMPAPLKLVGVVVGFVLGLVIPGVYIKILIKRRRDKFSQQLIDALMIMSSSFRGGLSLIQAMEAVVEEMPDPISQELGIVLNENKMGVSLEDALNHLYGRIPSSAIQQTITAILLARETGGNLPVIFSRIVNSIREHNKIQQNIDTLTLQGKIQGGVMALLPFGFAAAVYGSNPQFFDPLFTSEMGRLILVYAIFSELIGAYMIWKISTYKDF